MSLSKAIDSYGQVCCVLDDLATSSVQPASWRKVLYSAIDELRASSASEGQIDIAQRISVALLQLDWAMLKGDGDRQDKARQLLGALGTTWRAMSEPPQPLDAQSLDDVLELHEVEPITEALERLSRPRQ